MLHRPLQIFKLRLQKLAKTAYFIHVMILTTERELNVMERVLSYTFRHVFTP